MKNKLKPSYRFFDPANKLIKNGGSSDDVLELAKEFDMDEQVAKDWLKNQIKSKAFGEAFTASDEEKKAIYQNIDSMFVNDHPHIVIYSRGEYQSFYAYENGVYKHLLDSEMYNLVDSYLVFKNLLDVRTSSKRVHDILKRIAAVLARTDGRHYSDDSLIGQKWYLNLKNGLLDIETLELKEHTPRYFSTVQTTYSYNPKATCPLFDEFIKKVSGNNESTAQMIQEMYGYSLLPGNPRHKVFYLYGDTARNGKSTTAKILCGLIGWGNTSALTLQQIGSENSSVLTSIIGKQINFSDEISSKYIESSRLTAISAEGIVEVNPKYKPAFLYQVKTKFIIACNDLPRFSDFQGMKHRMISIPFRHHLKENERIERYDEILLAKEGEGILNWALEGVKMIRSKEFLINEESQEDIHENILQSYPVYSYLESTYDFDAKYVDLISIKDLYGTASTKDTKATGFRLFCEEQGLKTISFPVFSKEVSRFARETEKIEKVRVGHNRDRGYTGMALLQDIIDEQQLHDSF